jgi:type VI protein secretion system component VasA
MLARSTYEAEIATLRAALAELAPAHPLLAGHL